VNNVNFVLLTTYMIRREYERTHGGPKDEEGPIYAALVDLDVLKAKDFPVKDRLLSLDEFSKKQGWM
jgi:hypothetical protein